MKTFVASVFWLLSVAAWAQVTPGQGVGNVPSTPLAGPVTSGSSSLSFEAKSVSNGGATKVQNGGTTGLMGENLKSTQTHQSMIRLEVRVRNFGTAAGQGHLDCYFVATEFSHGKRYIWNTVPRDVTVPPGGEKLELVESSQLTQVSERTYQSEVTTDVTGSYRFSESAANRTSGSKPYGWIVRLMSGDRVLKVQASSSELENIARDPSLIAKMQQEQPKAPRPLGATPSPFLVPRRP